MPRKIKRESQWTAIYWDQHADRTKHGLYPYVRLVPEFMPLEAAGYPHGISMNRQFEFEQDAVKYADMVDDFMDKLAAVLTDQAAKVLQENPK
jgi:hypothetical protein